MKKTIFFKHLFFKTSINPNFELEGTNYGKIK